jgi:acyl carrier protein
MTSHKVADWDSVAHIKFMFTIESVFGTQLIGNELAEFKDIGELKRNEAQTGPFC